MGDIIRAILEGGGGLSFRRAIYKLILAIHNWRGLYIGEYRPAGIRFSAILGGVATREVLHYGVREYLPRRI